jgi:hypothetical protein
MMDWIRRSVAIPVLIGLILVVRPGMATGESKAKVEPAPNILTEEEKRTGWLLLFDGKSMDGWRTFKQSYTLPGWKVEDGTMACVDPKNAGDIVTIEKFDWFELSLEFKISEAGNSGIMFHVTDDGSTIWATGPEIQLEDNEKASDPIRTGWMYGLYEAEIDHRTNKPIDTTNPAGEWNHVRIVIASPPAESLVEVNGVKYYAFIWNSDDFRARVAKSKFKSLPRFAKSDAGFIGLQGDHGSVAFRNIKLRPIKG